MFRFTISLYIVGLKPDVLPLSKNAVMTTVVNVIAEHIPEVKLINLCNNRLSNLSNLSALVTKAPAVIALDLSNNEVRPSYLPFNVLIRNT